MKSALLIVALFFCFGTFAAETLSHPDLPNEKIGFPLHQIRMQYGTASLAGDWIQQNQEIDFESETGRGFEISYRVFPKAQLSAELIYSSSFFRVRPKTTPGFEIESSQTDLESLTARIEQSWVEAKNDLFSYGLGLQIGHYSFPTLLEVRPGRLQLEKVNNLIAGLSAHAHWLFLQPFSYKLRTGYDWGVGSVRSHDSEAHRQHSYYAELGVNYMLSAWSTFDLSAYHRVDHSHITNQKTGTSDEWEANSRRNGMQLSFTQTF